MPELTMEIDLAAPPERVWSVLTDFAAYPEWKSISVHRWKGRAAGRRDSVLPGT
jgi:uncharacterized protein YndB with AHSA1/START domain